MTASPFRKKWKIDIYEFLQMNLFSAKVERISFKVSS